MNEVGQNQVRHVRSADEWSELVRLYRERDCTQKEFIRRHGISSSSLDHYLRKERVAQGEARKFIPVSIERKQVVQEVVLEFSSGFCLKIRS